MRAFIVSALAAAVIAVLFTGSVQAETCYVGAFLPKQGPQLDDIPKRNNDRQTEPKKLLQQPQNGVARP